MKSLLLQPTETHEFCILHSFLDYVINLNLTKSFLILILCLFLIVSTKGIHNQKLKATGYKAIILLAASGCRCVLFWLSRVKKK